MIEITDNGNSVELLYRDGDGNAASAVIIGLSATVVRDRAQEFVDAHNLTEAAQS